MDVYITPELLDGMTPDEKEYYLEHAKMRIEQELVKIANEKERMQSYRKMLIEDILARTNRYGIETLKLRSTKELEQIFDNC